MLRLDPAYAEKAARVSALAKDITEYLATLDLPEPAARPGSTVAYHSACSMQHGQKITRAAEGAARQGRLHRARAARGASLLRLGRHLQHPAAGDRRAAARPQGRRTSRRPAPTLIATGNIGCITQIALGADDARSCTRSNCSTGPMAARGRRALPAAPDRPRNSERAARPLLAAPPLPAGRAPADRADLASGRARHSIYITMTLVPTSTRS